MARRLQTADVVNRGLMFAGVLLLCFLPFLFVLQSLVGRTVAAGFVQRFGLTGQAERAVRQALTSPTPTSNTVSGLSWVVLVLGLIAAATAIQELYERVFEVEGRGLRDTPRRVVWVAAAVAVTLLSGWAEPAITRAGGLALDATISLLGGTFFWWFSMRLLLAGRRSWRELFPSALATGLCWLGMVLVFRLTISSTITTQYDKYGAIGVVFVIMTLLIAIGVVIILGAVLGLAWQERRRQPGNETRKNP
ncbi:MAG TPA: YhjD/YihY/BrkB family envelope integrity protein [Streptosporangiaceae bacterium]|nr:YhjD/YihY/BrkB family envelope integrity protein [Streptosporangiaceae bacterium]HYK71023.1 YhjD/YihY/BrkB family envelope integrity protein [Streptosporangiaceae bacterium]